MKVSKHFRISEECIEYIKQIQQKENLSSENAALSYIISQHKELQHSIADSIVATLDEKFSKTFTRIRLGVNNADRNSQILLELLNTILLETKVRQLSSTDAYKTKPFEEAEAHVKNRIQAFRQKQLEKEQSKEG